MLSSVSPPAIGLGLVPPAKEGSAKVVWLLAPAEKEPATYSNPAGIRTTTRPLVPVTKFLGVV